MRTWWLVAALVAGGCETEGAEGGGEGGEGGGGYSGGGGGGGGGTFEGGGGGGGVAGCSLGSGSVADGPTMRPGEDCIGCHSAGEGPDFEIAGTVMPAVDEPSDCQGVDRVTVRVTDATGHVKTLLTNAAGNFYTLDPIVPPYTVELDAGGVTSQMYSPQTETDCMVCHTASGKNGAPGRIVAPG